MHILQSVRSPSAAHIAVKADFKPDVRHLAVARHSTLETYLMNPNTPPYLTMPAKLVFPAKIDAMVCVTINDADTVAVFAHGTLHFVQLHKSGLQVVHRVEIGQGTEPVKMFALGTTPSCHLYVVVHHRQGFITVVDLKSVFPAEIEREPHLRGRNGRRRPPKRHQPGPNGSSQKRARPGLASRTYCIGHVSAISFVSLYEQKPTFVLLCRDVQFAYSLRRYSFADLDSPLLVFPIHEFLEAPLLAFAAAGGVMVMSDLRCYFFPAPHAQAALQAHKKIAHTSTSSAGRVVTLDLLAHDSFSVRAAPGTRSDAAVSLLGALFLSYAQISPSRHILVSDMGHTVEVTFEYSSSATLTVVSAFSAASLGWSTVASSLVQISHDVLFAASTLSRSVLLRVDPHLGVLAFLPSSPPVLDFASSPIDNEGLGGDEGVGIDDLIVAQGGFHAGELVVQSKGKYKSVFINSTTVEQDASGLLMETIGNASVVFWVSGPGWKRRGELTLGRIPGENHFGFRTKKPTSGNTLQSHEQNQAQRQLLPEVSFVKRFSCGEVYLQDSSLVAKSSTHCKLALPSFSQPTSLEVYEDGVTVHVIVLTWSGVIYWLVIENGIQLYVQSQFPLQGNISATICPISEGRKLIVAVDSSGNLVQRVFVNDRDISTVQTQATMGYGPYTLAPSPNLSMLLLRSSRTICALSPIKNNPFLYLSEIFTTSRHILDCQSAGDGRILVLHSHGNISLVSYAKVPLNNNTNFSKRMFFKVLKNSKDIVAIQLEFRPNRSIGSMERISSLSLFNRTSLKLRSTYNRDVKCMCWLGKNNVGLSNAHFVTAGTSEDPSRIFSIYKISKGKLELVAQPEIVGRYPKPFSVSKVAWIDGKLHAVGNAYVVLTLSPEDGDLRWASEVKGSLSPSRLMLGIDVCKVAGQVFVADASRGILAYNDGDGYDDSKDFFQPMNLKFSPCFVTAIAACGNLLVYGDSVGNVGAFSVQGMYMGARSMGLVVDHYSYKQIFGCNIGDAVNTINVRNNSVFIGTSGGGIFRISNISVSDRLISECDRKLRDWRTFDKAEQSAAGILDGEFIMEARDDEAERVVYQMSI